MIKNFTRSLKEIYIFNPTLLHLQHACIISSRHKDKLSMLKKNKDMHYTTFSRWGTVEWLI